MFDRFSRFAGRKAVFATAATGKSEGGPGGLVRDPVCGVFVVPGRALHDGTGEATRYFCSEDCRRKWMKR